MLTAVKFIAVLSCTFLPEPQSTSILSSTLPVWAVTQKLLQLFGQKVTQATVLQASLAILSFLSGVSAWLPGDSVLWLIGALIVGLVVPFTFIVIMPTNHQLLEPF